MTRQQRLEALVAKCWRLAHGAVGLASELTEEQRVHAVRRRREDFEASQRELASYVMINVDRPSAAVPSVRRSGRARSEHPTID